MAIGDYAISKVTPVADRVNSEAWTARDDDANARMPEIRYFIPAYDEDVIIRDSQGSLWMKTPWFWELNPSDPADLERHYHNLAALQIDDIHNITHIIPGVLKYTTADDDSEKGLVCDIDSRKISRASNSDGGSIIKVILEHKVEDHRNKIFTDGVEANVFYIMDSDFNILCVLHAYGFTFAPIDKWEIIQTLIYQHDGTVDYIPEDNNPFDLGIVAEALMPEMIVGDANDITDGEIGSIGRKANYDLNALPQDHDFRNKRVLFLETVKNATLPAAVSTINGSNIHFIMENPNAKLNLNGRTLTIDGDGLRGSLNVFDSQGEGRLTISGNNVNLEIAAYGAADGEMNNAVVNFTGTGLCVINGQLNNRGAGEDVVISQNIETDSLKTKSLRVNTNQTAADGEIIAGKLKFNNSQAEITNNGDIETMRDILKGLGVVITKVGEKSHQFDASRLTSFEPDKELCGSIRGSFLLLAPLLSRLKRAKLHFPGGDSIGRRRLDTHVAALEKLGVEIERHEEYFLAKADNTAGTYILLDEASVMATENVIMASVLTKGKTTVYNAACEPHVQGLCRMLNNMGAKIAGVGSNLLQITGVEALSGGEHAISPDHTEVGSLIGLAAVTRSELTIVDPGFENLRPILPYFKRLGVKLEESGRDLFIPGDQDLKIETDIDLSVPRIDDGPWPAFPADLSSIMVMLATQCRGTVIIFEKMFESRLFWVDGLIRMGAKIILCDPHRAVVTGPSRLKGANLASPDIRAGMALLIAALCADGVSEIQNINQIDRGYEKIEERLNQLGADIQRV